MVEQFQDRIRGAQAAKGALRLRGGGSLDWYGQSLDGDVLDTRPYSGIVAYEPTELVITARCGTSLAEIEAALAEHNQMLAFEPPHFGKHATVGGMLAGGLSGPRRATSGAVRDFVLGALLLNGKAEVLKFGGQVMKNVAGYDVSRLLTGSMGTLGLILECSIKVLPRPFREASLRFAMSEIEAIARLNAWGGQPLPISASCWVDGELTLRLSGAEAAVAEASALLGGDELADGAAFWRSLREQQHAFFADAPTLWRLSVPSAASALILRGSQLIEWGGAQRWLRADADNARSIRSTVAAAGGHATLFRGGDKGVGVFHPLAPGVAAIHARLKNAFDPQQVFNPGRMG